MGPVFSQNMGVIEVNEDFTATLNFTNSIVFIVVGNNPSVGENKNKYYDIFQMVRTVLSGEMTQVHLKHQ